MIEEKKNFPELPPKVEYHVIDFGKKFIKILDEIENLNNEVELEKTK